MSATKLSRSSREVRSGRENVPRNLSIGYGRLAIGLSLVISAATIAMFGSLMLHAAPRNRPPIVSVARDGRLAYDTEEHGNRVPDFSHCGYAGGDRPVPDAPVQVIVEPQRGDNTARIQRALDYVAALPPGSDGLRGAVLLLKGRHEVLGGLQMTNSGVALRGQGIGAGGTVLVAAGLDRRTLVRIAGRNDRKTRTSADWRIRDDYVPVGATSFRLKNASGLNVGDTIVITRPSTQAWIDRLGTGDFGGVGGGWKPGTRDIFWDRIIKAVGGATITVDAAITTAIEIEFGGGHLERYDWPGRITNVGIENLQLESEYDAKNPRDENHSWCAITIENARDAWVRQVTFKYFAGSAVAVFESASRVTVEDCLSREPISEDGGARRNTYFTMGQQTLFLRCYSEHGRHDFSVGHCAAGPNAFVQCEASLPLRDSGPLESWASGVLYDNVRIDGHALTFGNRGPRLGGAGWAAANSVLWNCSASRIVCASSPGARNWSFGSWAEFEGDGIWRSSNDFMTPESLFVAQLRDRLGDEAAQHSQLMPRPREESSNPPLDKAQELAAASHKPAPLLTDFIALAAKRSPISGEPGAAKRLEDIGEPISKSAQSATTDQTSALLFVTNGWLTIGGKLLTGGTVGVAWWRGNTRPSEQTNFSVALTRFAPGRTGHGFTDDLNEVADWMVANHRVALDHNYGLWYDRRRDDHERVRRMDGDVWPPFFEPPFARSGEGTAWDGLSRYDLAKFNPWYWARLGEFAQICEKQGLVLFHQNYFQHNLLEAGAHWADSPWRSANNINDTGFPEPPPYAGDKRIFMAELFYDVTHPVRRELHRRYIRQCLDNFAGHPNVIQFTSAEFTGPRQFMEFWLDVVDEWERENPGSGERGKVSSEIRDPKSEIRNQQRRPLVALSATKEVQDAIIADPKRAAVVDVIDFRYWWRTAKGEFAPPGGKNLAPRQFERQWRGGRPTDLDVAQMASEYRAKFPAKPVICDFDSAGWAWLCAGGSLPRLPKTTDAQLLTAMPRMQPWKANASERFWALREPGRQMLVFTGERVEIDLSDEDGLFRVFTVDGKTGALKLPHQSLRGGGLAKLPLGTGEANIIWLTKE